MTIELTQVMAEEEFPAPSPPMLDKPFKCQYMSCTHAFTNHQNLVRHTKIHQGELPYKCDEEGCCMAFSKKFQLLRHASLTHGTRLPYACDVDGCGKRFEHPSKLRRHAASHDPTLRYCCSEDGCEAAFVKWTLLRRHIKEAHHGKRTATKAEPESPSPVSINDGDERVCVKRDWLDCPLCQKSFTCRASLLCHLQNLHSMADVRHMPESELMAALGPVLMRRLLSPPTHVACEASGCLKSFRSKSAARVHFRTAHQGLRPFACELCSDTFGHKHLLARHKRQLHGLDLSGAPVSPLPKGAGLAQPQPSPATATSVASLLSGMAYLMQRPLACPLPACPKRFLRQYDLDRHVKAHHPPQADAEQPQSQSLSGQLTPPPE